MGFKARWSPKLGDEVRFLVHNEWRKGEVVSTDRIPKMFGVKAGGQVYYVGRKDLKPAK